MPASKRGRQGGASASIGIPAASEKQFAGRLHDGPFGGDGQPCSKAIVMEIVDGPLEKESFDTIDAFVAAIDELPNPAAVASSASGAGDVSMEEVKAAIGRLFDARDSHRAAIKSLQDQVALLTQRVTGLEFNQRAPL